ncbi:MAG: putative proline iminopeptidase [Candidatus Saccharibacteria bacterium]|nr:putative proline iminopeptidase [Candidatus Saccharibacteria bacterium]
MLNVGDGHDLYVQDWGNKDAKTPIVFLHGGPGAGVKDRHKQRFDPKKQRLIFFDQRGAGKSSPKGSIEHNTTQDLVEDIEKLAKHLKLDTFIITGGSWGVCLAFAYAFKYPERVTAMVLSGIYTATRAETEHIDNGGFRSYYPDVWENYVNRAPKEYADDPSSFHYAQALGNDAEAAKASIYAYSELEGSLLSLDDRYTPENFEEFDPNNMKIELHYLANNCFIPEGYIAQNAPKLTMPIWLVQGRYDMVCPPITAYNLNKQLKNSHLIWTVAGHGNDRANYDVMRTILLQATGK